MKVMKNRTLRVRFSLWVAAMLFLVLVAFGVFVYLSMAESLSSAIDESLRLSALQAIAAVNSENGKIDFSDALPESGSLARDLRSRGLTIRLISPAGEMLHAFGPYSALPLTPESLKATHNPRGMYTTVADASSHADVRFFTMPILDNGQVAGVIQAAQSLDVLRQTLGQLVAVLLVGGPLLILFAGLGGYLLASRALAPIGHITRTARRISAGSLSERLNLPATKDEVGELAATFDEMLQRLEDSFYRERQFTADASHELRTPLAAMQAILSVIRSKRRSPEDYEQALADLSEESDRLGSMIEDLLTLAREDSRRRIERETVDLSVTLKDVADSLRPLAQKKGLDLVCNTPSKLALAGDRDSLVRLFVNILDNAVKFTQKGSITISARETAKDLEVSVSDTGTGIAEEHLPHIFDRFYRVDASRSSRGAGLGLAIAKDIARSHGGIIRVASGLGSGTTFTVEFPK